MSSIEQVLFSAIKNSVKTLYGSEVNDAAIQLQKTRKDFTGDITLVVFPLLKISKKSPDITAKEIGQHISENTEIISGFEVVKGFLNLSISNTFWLDYLKNTLSNKQYGIIQESAGSKTIMVEYSSPNTNKPLHLGHIRNNLIGYSIANLLKAAGHNVIKVNLVNDRGIHICKSMLAWEKWGNGITPDIRKEELEKFLQKFKTGKFYKNSRVYNFYKESTIKSNSLRIYKFLQNNDFLNDHLIAIKNCINSIDTILIRKYIHNELKSFFLYELKKVEKIYSPKGDHLVGDFYVMFDKHYKKEISELMAKGATEEEAVKNAPLIKEAQEMLRKWEAGDKHVVELWEMMNGWVYKGFDETYKKLGVNFDRIYYESQTYLLGKAIILEGLEKGNLYKKTDNSVWADLTTEGLDHKVLLRSDGTSVYMTQDVGTAHQRFTEYNLEKLIYVVGNEQNYHFQALKIVLKKLGYNWHDKIEHLSYGMVELPEGKMKSREGTVVDADDLVEEMVQTALQMSTDLGKLEGLEEKEKQAIINSIALAALKYFILKVDPKKNMVFDPKESIDFNGNTGPFIQYTYARIRSVFRKGGEREILPGEFTINTELSAKEKELIKLIYDFPGLIVEAANTMSPAIIANYLFELSKEYNQFYHDFSILKEENNELRNLRLHLSEKISEILKTGMWMLGIEMPERM